MSILLRGSDTLRDVPLQKQGISIQPVIPSRYFRWQSLLDRLMAVVLLFPTLLAIGVLGLLVRLTSRGPAIYSQRRVGLNGKHFTMYKLRTMRHDAELATGPVWSLPRDPRITFIGRFLRALHLDELPQILNVFLGDMALVGPRPERPDIAVQLVKQIPNYLERLRVKPGVTGLAQVNLPPDIDVENVRRKLVVDLEYVESASLSLDLRILLCTFLRVFGLRGRWFSGLLGIKRRGLSSSLSEGPPTSAVALQTATNSKEEFHHKVIPK